MIWSLHNVALLGQGFSRFVMGFFWCCWFSIVLLRSACGRSLWFGAIKWHQVALSMNLRILEVLQYNDSTSCFMLHLFRSVSWTLEPFDRDTYLLYAGSSYKQTSPCKVPPLPFAGVCWTEASTAICRTLPMKQSWTRSSAPCSMAYQRPKCLCMQCMVFTFPIVSISAQKNGPNLHAVQRILCIKEWSV